MGNLAPDEADILQKFVFCTPLAVMYTEYKLKATIIVNLTTLHLRL
jgi:hypothetical protein